ncbi:molybdopterin-dependent oxidoreductase [Salmonella enterica subsp. enterica serovar Senftenberg]|nr:molybdopterin-dependent oxidoreductase [Salmonella enterica subsp. enterica serovar Senftenberg]
MPAALSRSSASTRSSPPRTIIWGAIRSNISPLTRRRMSRYNWRWRIPCTARNCTIKISSITIASVLTSSSPICWARKMDSLKMPPGGKLCGIDADTIRALARQMAGDRTQIIAGWCVQRMQHGEQWSWMVVVLAAMLGQIGLPGGGFGFGWHYNGAGTPGRKGSF